MKLFFAEGFLQHLLLLFVQSDFSMEQGDESRLFQFDYAAVYGLDAGANIIGNLLTAGMEDKEVGFDVAQSFQQITVQAVEAGQEFYPSGLVGGGVHFCCQLLGNGQSKVIVNLHPLEEGFCPHDDGLCIGNGFIGGGVEFLAGQYLQVANQVGTA